MGYCIELRNSSFKIKSENKENTLKAIKGLAGQETIGDSSGRHFSWVNTPDFFFAKTLEEAMKAWRWAIYSNPDGDIDEISFCGQKLGDDEILFSAMAPFVENDSFLEMHGEDGSMWRWVFKDGKLEEKTATVSWED